MTPPVTSALPLGSRLALLRNRGLLVLAATLHAPVEGLYSSHDVVAEPPMASTRPSLSLNALWLWRAVLRAPVVDQVLVAGS